MSDFKIGNKKIENCTPDEIETAIRGTWEAKREAELKLRAYEDLLRSPFPRHIVWRQFAENAMYSIGLIWIIFLLIKVVK